MSRIESDGRLKVRDRLGNRTLRFKSRAKIVMRIGVVRIDIDGRAIGFDSRRQLAGRLQTVRQIEPGQCRAGFNFNRAMKTGLCLVES